MEASTPIERVTPNPRTGPDARKNSSPAASRVVMLESAIALSVAETGRQRGAKASPAAGGVLLPCALEHQHVGVHRHADGQHEAGEAGQGQCGAEGEQRRVGDQPVPGQRHGGDRAQQPVDEEDEQRGQDHADQRGLGAGVDRGLPERWADGALLDDLHRHRQGAAADEQRQVTSLGRGEPAGDLGGPTGNPHVAGDLRIDLWGRDDLVVQHDGDPPGRVTRRGAGRLSRQLRPGPLAEPRKSMMTNQPPTP
jgi:hypothetical protein